MLKTVAIVSGGGGNGSGTVTSITAGTGLSGGTITTSGTIALANTAVTVGSYGTSSSVSQVTINAQGQITSAANVTIAIANTQVSGLGTMSVQNSNSVTITGGTVNIPNVFQGYTTVTAANATTTLSSTSTHWQKTTGTGTQTFTLPDATTLPNGASYIFDNDATGNVTINDNSSALVDTLIPGAVDVIFLESNSTAAGSWGKYSWLPAYVNWGTSTADFGNVSVSNVTIIGGTINVTQEDFLTVITLQNDSDGKGDYIAKWEHPTLVKPTDDELLGK